MSERPKYGLGAYDRYVEVQSVAEAEPGYPTETWATLFRTSAYREDLSGTERFVSDRLSAPYDTKWVMPYRPEMDPDTIDVRKTRRLVYQGRVYDIVSAQQIGRKDGIALQTLAGALTS